MAVEQCLVVCQAGREWVLLEMTMTEHLNLVNVIYIHRSGSANPQGWAYARKLFDTEVLGLLRVPSLAFLGLSIARSAWTFPGYGNTTCSLGNNK